MTTNRGRQTGTRQSHVVAVLLGLALLAGCGTGGTPVQATGTTDAGSVHGATVPVVKVSLEKCPAAAPATGGDRLPQLRLACMGSGPAVDMATGHGRPTVVNLWASWCDPCRTEMPRLRASATRLGPRVGFLGVDVKDDPGAAWAFLSEMKVHYPNVADPSGSMLTGLRVPGVPITFVLDASGVIVYRHIGELHETDIAEMQAAALAAP